MQGASTDANNNGPKWQRMTSNENSVLCFCCVVSVVKSRVSVSFFTGFFPLKMISHKSNFMSHSTELHAPSITHLGLISHMSYSGRTKSHHIIEQVALYALLLRNKFTIEQEVHCNTRGAIHIKHCEHRPDKFL